MTPVADPARVLLYDSDCGICTRTVEFILSRGATVTAQPASLWEHDEPSQEQLAAEIWLVGETTHRGAAAIGETLMTCRRPWWRQVGRAITSRPVRPLAAFVYRWVARHRRAISTRLGMDACRLPPRR